jgi:tRNA(Ile)-lysidine synthase
MDGNGRDDLNPGSIRQRVQALSAKKQLWVGFSGGLDSQVLLHLTIHAFANMPDYQVNAIFVHHNLSPNEENWVQQNKVICQALKVSLMVLHVDATKLNGESPEAVARDLRYQAFERVLKEDDCLLLAHHEADQAETILWRLFRGTGPLGLGGIPETGTVGKAQFIRPLLTISKEAILQYAEQNQLRWIEDEANLNLRFDRNFIRHQILPVLKERWPHVLRSINRAGALCLEAAMEIQIRATNDLDTLYNTETGTLSVSQLLALAPARRREVIRCWLQRLGFALPSRDHLARIDREVLKAKPGAKPRLKISRYELKRVQDALSVEALESER